MSWQSNEMKEATENADPVLRLLDVIELLHPLPLSDPKHGFVDIPRLIIDAYAVYNPMKVEHEGAPNGTRTKPTGRD